MIRLCTTLFFAILSAVVFSQTRLPFESATAYPGLFSIPLSNVQSQNNDDKILTKDEALYVYIFLSPECPLCQHYIPELKRLQDTYSGNIIIAGIVPGKSYSRDTLVRFINDYKINFPVYIDSAKLLTNYLSATVTPEVMLFTKNTEKMYSGAIDDWMKELGVKRIQPSQHYLRDAITAILKGKKPAIIKTEAKGCLINDL